MTQGLGLTAVAKASRPPSSSRRCVSSAAIGQGYYFARPGAAPDVTPLLESPQPFAALLSSP